MKLAFCGLGLMGAPMARRLLAAGHEVFVWNRDPAKAQALALSGATPVASPREAAEAAGLVLLCLTDDAAVEEVVFGPGGVAAGAPGLIVDHSSISPAATRGFAARLARAVGGVWIDAPVSGGVSGAETGRLSCMAGGPEVSLEDARPVLMAYCRSVVRMGQAGAGQAAKLCNQAIVAGVLELVAEALELAVASGLDAARLPEALAGGWADSIPLQLFAPRMLADPATPIATLATFMKDLDNVGAAAHATGAAMPLVDRLRDIYRAGVAAGHGANDVSVLHRLLRAPAS